MSEENVDVVRSAFELWVARGSTADVFPADVFDADIEWDVSGYPLPDWPNRGRGRGALLRNLAVYLSGWKSYESTISEYIDAGDDVVVLFHERVRMRGSETNL